MDPSEVRLLPRRLHYAKNKKMKRKKKHVKILEAGITLPLSCAQQKELLGWGLSGNEYDFYHNFIQEMGIVHNANFIDHKTMMDLR